MDVGTVGIAGGAGRARAALATLRGETDDRLARRVAGGDERAFETLVRRYRGPIGRYCRAFLRHDQDAEDAVQQTMIRAYRGLGREVPAVAVRPWLYRIAHNECLRLATARREDDPLSGGERAAASAGPAAQAEVRDDLRRLRDDLRALPPGQRAALVLRELSGLSHEQIGVALDATPAHAKHLVHEARVALAHAAAGRSLACEEVCRRLSDGDGRVLRARTVTAHLRACPGCRDFRAALTRRPRDLAALFPALPGLLAERSATALLMGGAGAAGAGGGSSALGGVWAAGAGVLAATALLVSTIGPGVDRGPAAPAPSAAAGVAPAVTTPATAVPVTARADARPAAAGAHRTAAPAGERRTAPAPAAAAPAATPASAPPPVPVPPTPAEATAPPASPPPSARAEATAPPGSPPPSASAAVAAGATVSAPAVVPGAAAVDASVTAREGGVQAGASAAVETPVTPPAEVEVDADVDPEGGVEVVVRAPVVPDVEARVPLPGLAP